MLGNDRFSFETPNVIDPGDMPPSRPNREQDRPTSAFAPIRSTTNANSSGIQHESVQEYNQVRESATRLLRDIADLDLQPPPPSAAPAPYDPYDEDDNQHNEANDNSYIPHGSHWNSGFNKEKLHLYAASIMKNESQPLSLSRTVKLHEGRTKPKHRVANRLVPSFRSLGKVVKALIAIGIFIGVVIASMKVYRAAKSDEGDGDSTLEDRTQKDVQSQRYELLVRVLADNGISSSHDLKTAGTPQYRAADWLANDDGEEREISEMLTLSNDFNRIIQRYTLAVLYFATGGKQRWIDNLNFVTAADECSWFTQMAEPQFADESFAIGVGCNENLLIDSIFIPNNGLVGTIPLEIRFLTDLKLLAFQHNDLKGNIPDALEDMSQLIYLNLNYNQFDGSISSYFGDFADLAVLGLSNNKLTGRIPASLGTLGSLKSLWLDNNNLSGDIGFAKHLLALEYLYVDNSGLTGELGSTFFSNLIHLRHVDVSDNNIRGEINLKTILDHGTLEVVDLANNSFTGSFPETVGNRSGLEYLSLRANTFNGTIPRDIGSLTKLKHLDLNDNSFNGEIPNDLGGIRGLRYLFLGGNLFTADIPPLSQLVSLRELSLAGLNLQVIPSWIGYLKQLQLLDLQNNSIDGSISTQIWNLPDLKYLILNDNNLSGPIPDTDIGGQKLKFLALHHNEMSGSADQVCAIAKNLTAIAIDCSIQCSKSCCSSCCARSDPNCFNDEIADFMTSTQGQWEFKYTHSPDSLDPKVLESADEAHIVTSMTETNP